MSGTQIVSEPQQMMSNSVKSHTDDATDTQTKSAPQQTMSRSMITGNNNANVNQTVSTSDSLEMATLYDEDIPRKDPFGCLPVYRHNLEESKLDEDAPLSLKLHYPPMYWKKEGLGNICMAALLQSIYLKNNHRASVWLTHERLEEMHKELHRHLSSENMNRINGMKAIEDVCEVKDIRSLDEASQLRHHLDDKGWCMIENCDFIKGPLETMDTVYENAPDTFNGEALWEIIRNKKEETMSELVSQGKGRRKTSKVGVMEFLEDNSEVWIERVKIDI